MNEYEQCLLNIHRPSMCERCENKKLWFVLCKMPTINDWGLSVRSTWAEWKNEVFFSIRFYGFFWNFKQKWSDKLEYIPLLVTLSLSLLYVFFVPSPCFQYAKVLSLNYIKLFPSLLVSPSVFFFVFSKI